MTANYDDENNVAHGCIAGNRCLELVNDIMQNGENLTFEEAKKELTDRLDKCEDIEEINSVLKEFRVQPIDDDFEDVDIDSLVDQCLESWENDECSYYYKEEQNGYEILLSYLGGAIILHVMKSKYVAYCRPCSPCVPNAGDLDNMSKDSHYLAYSIAPDDIDEYADLDKEAIHLFKDVKEQ